MERFGTLLFWRNVERNWNGTISNSKVYGTEHVPIHSWVERNGTSSNKIGTEYNTGFDHVMIVYWGTRLLHTAIVTHTAFVKEYCL